MTVCTLLAKLQAMIERDPLINELSVHIESWQGERGLQEEPLACFRIERADQFGGARRLILSGESAEEFTSHA